MEIPSVEELNMQPELLPLIRWRIPSDAELLTEFASEYGLESLFYPSREINAMRRPYAREGYIEGIAALRQMAQPTTITPAEAIVRINYRGIRHLVDVSTRLGGPKDPLTMIEAAFVGRELPMPIAVHRRNDTIEILGGNTRWGLAHSSMQELTVYMFEEDDAKCRLADMAELYSLQRAEDFELGNFWKILREILYTGEGADTLKKHLVKVSKKEFHQIWTVALYLSEACRLRGASNATFERLFPKASFKP